MSDWGRRVLVRGMLRMGRLIEDGGWKEVPREVKRLARVYEGLGPVT